MFQLSALEILEVVAKCDHLEKLYFQIPFNAPSESKSIPHKGYNKEFTANKVTSQIPSS
jgi:hypothetical protein